ncbi:hypothetical protein SEA_BUNKER_43 [Gordonia phage Bunker]|nr:hypothetical protein SEA_BUNKER_43 [Gordonia phage Bunker]
MFLELYSASVITIMFVTAVVVWIRDERRHRRDRRAYTRVRAVDELADADLARKRDVRRAKYMASTAARR